MDTEPIARFFDRENEDCCRPDAELGEGISGVAGTVLDAVEEAGLDGETLLDLGCGTGALAVEAARRGASAATGVDLSPTTIEVARRRAREAGLEGRTSFLVGDASLGEVEPHDAVTLNKAVCCFPDPAALLGSAASAARRLVAFSAPESRGVWGLITRAVVFLENLWRRFRGDPFRAYVHDVRSLDRTMRDRDFTLRSARRRWSWLVSVYVREA